MDRFPTIMTVEEVAQYLRVHVMTVYRMVYRGELRAARVGRGWRFKRSEIEQWLTENWTGNSQQPARHRRSKRSSQ